MRGPDHYTMSDEAGRAPDIVIHPGQHCESRTGESLAVSMRLDLARRFHDVVGEPPITYLTRWRLSRAADLICQPQASVTSVTRAVGSGSPFAPTTAFKRQYGLSPHQHRVAERGADRD